MNHTQRVLNSMSQMTASQVWKCCMVLKILVLLLMLINASTAVASESIRRLDQFFAQVQSFQGRFIQTVYDEDDEVLQRAQGEVALQKPGRFSWQYTQPYPQLILADGKYLWIYDEELQQASAKPLDTALGNAPIMLLTGIRPLADDFEIKEVADREDGLSWIELIPLVQDTEFHQIHIGLDETGVRKMALRDHFLQKTVIEFVGMQTNVPFEPDQFTFTAAEGVDVVGYPESP